MTKNEVVKRLNVIREYCSSDWSISLNKDYVEALTEAILCVQIVPELVEALEVALSKLEEDWYGKGIDDMRELIKKAKGEE